MSPNNSRYWNVSDYLSLDVSNDFSWCFFLRLCLLLQMKRLQPMTSTDDFRLKRQQVYFWSILDFQALDEISCCSSFCDENLVFLCLTLVLYWDFFQVFLVFLGVSSSCHLTIGRLVSLSLLIFKYSFLVPSLVHKYICQIHFSLLLQEACFFIRFTSCKEYVWSRRVKCVQILYILLSVNLNVNGTLMLQFKWVSLTWILLSRFFTRDFSTAIFWRAFIWGKDIILLFMVKLVDNSEIKSN